MLTLSHRTAQLKTMRSTAQHLLGPLSVRKSGPVDREVTQSTLGENCENNRQHTRKRKLSPPIGRAVPRQWHVVHLQSQMASYFLRGYESHPSQLRESVPPVRNANSHLHRNSYCCSQSQRIQLDRWCKNSSRCPGGANGFFGESSSTTEPNQL